jgi:hypothetical protein
MKRKQINIEAEQPDSRASQLSRTAMSFPPGPTCGGIVFLFILMMVVMACGSDTGQYVPGTPVSTLTVVFGQFKASPTPPLSPFYCGGWATDTTPAYRPNSVINVYGKFTRTQNGNPVGVNGAVAVARVLWPDGSTQTQQTTTASDGLAVFSITLQASAINHIVLVQMTFTSPSGQTCSLTSPAFFTAIVVSPTPTTTPSASPTPCHRRRCATPTPIVP